MNFIKIIRVLPTDSLRNKKTERRFFNHMDILQKIKIKRDVQLERELSSFRRPSLKEALKRPGLQIIGEIKRASPSKGQIAEEGFDLIRQADHYVNNNIAAFSILTEEEYFKGDNEFIKKVGEHFPDVPILRKDFIYTPFQVAHSKFLGASALLLIVRMLDDSALHELHKLTYELEMEALVEVHDEAELERALKIPGLQILGVNNRNLNTFEVNITTTKKLMDRIPDSLKKDITLVGESGFLNEDDLKYAKTINVDGLLIGEALMKGNLFNLPHL